MSENIFEHTTSIVGLTCKPLSILSETISPQEMSRARGGDGMGGGGPGSMSSGQNPGEAKAERQARRAEAQRLVDEQTEQTDIAGLGGPLGGTYIPTINVSGSLNTNAQADSSGTQDPNGGALDNEVENFWDFDFLDDDDTEDECTVPYDCGDDEEEEDYSEEETEEETEPSP